MKRGLSVLLIIAALLGFYGGASGLNDVLAARDYWNKQNEITSEDLSKLEDGLNQLVENREDYLDGKQELADGEEELADAEKQLADGREQLDDAYAQLASTPEKLAKAKTALAEGKDQLDDAAKQLSGLKTLVSYLGTIDSTYEAWKTKYEKIASERAAVAKTVKSKISYLKGYEDFISDATSKAAFDSYISMLAANDVSGAGVKNFAAEGYIGYINVAAGVVSTCGTIKDSVDKMVTALSGVKSGLEDCQDITKTDNNGYDAEKLKTFAETYASNLSALGITDTQIASLKNGSGSTAGDVYETISTNYTTYSGYQSTLNDLVAAASPALSAMSSFVKTYGTATGGTPAYTSSYVSALAGADGGQGYMAAVMQKISAAVAGSSTTKKAVKKSMGRAALILLKRTAADPNFVYPYVRGTIDSGCDFEEFEKYMEDDPALLTFFSNTRKMLIKALKSGNAAYKKGLKAYRSGLAQYKQGLKAYADAPATLAEAEAKLADGEKQIEEGRDTLELGKSKLSEYEDGEQRVRDGLAELMNTKAEGGLESILDRAGGDDDFDDGEGWINIDKGLDAVDTGRGYQSDLAVVIKKEITERAAGTAVALLAALLALIAAAMSFGEKYRKAGILAILSAVAGTFAAYYGHAAGSVFTEQAGITSVNMAWLAAGVLAAIALIHAALHFTAKKEG